MALLNDTIPADKVDTLNEIVHGGRSARASNIDCLRGWTSFVDESDDESIAADDPHRKSFLRATESLLKMVEAIDADPEGSVFYTQGNDPLRPKTKQLTRNEELELPPKVDDEPVKVYCTTVIKNISQIDVVGESAYVVFSVNTYWYDHRISKIKLSPSGTLPRDIVTLWRPGFTCPQGDVDVFISTSPSWKDVRVEDHQLGLVSTWTEFKGRVAMKIDLQNFPFDECKLECRFTGGRLRDGCPSNKAEFVLMDCPPPEKRFENLSFFNMVPLDFEARCSHKIVGLYTNAAPMGDCSTVTWGVVMRRNSKFLLWRCLFVLWALFTASLAAYSIPPQQIDSRIEVSATLIVAAMAVLSVFTNDLPKTGSLTRLDFLFISTICMMMCPVLETIMTTNYLHTQQEGEWPDVTPTEDAVDLCRKIDFGVMGVTVLLYIYLNLAFWFFPQDRLDTELPLGGIAAAWKYMSWTAEKSKKFCAFRPETEPKPKEEVKPNVEKVTVVVKTENHLLTVGNLAARSEALQRVGAHGQRVAAPAPDQQKETEVSPSSAATVHPVGDHSKKNTSIPNAS